MQNKMKEKIVIGCLFLLAALLYRYFISLCYYDLCTSILKELYKGYLAK